jgi:hypothetical protein
MLLKNILRELRKQLSIILGDSKNLQEVLIHLAEFFGRTTNPEKQENSELRTQLTIPPSLRS